MEQNTSALAGMFGVIFVFILIAVLIMVIGFWKVFTKAGQPGWATIIPIFNIIVLLGIVERPTWWIVLLLIPFVNIVIELMICLDLARVFGKSTGFGVGLFLLPIIFVPILGFGEAEYASYDVVNVI
jgi:hypothetical protein